MQQDTRMATQNLLDKNLFLGDDDPIQYKADLSNLQEGLMAFGEIICIADPAAGIERKLYLELKIRVLGTWRL